MSYPVIKCLLEHLDPNLRFKLALSCPLIKNLEKLVHLHIKYLKLTDHSITINKDTYQFTVHNTKNGFLHDIDERDELDLSPIHEDPNELIIDVRKNIRWYFRAANVSSENTIQLKIGDKFEILRYRRKMHEALKYLLGKLFEGKTVKVNHLTIKCGNVIRILSTVKFRVKILEVLDENTYDELDTIRSIIQTSSLPLNVETFRFLQAPVSRHELIRTAGMLEIRCSIDVHTLATLNHRRVHAPYFYEWRSNCFVDFLEIWMEYGKEIGSYYTFNIFEHRIDKAMKRIRKMYKRSVEAGSARRAGQLTLNMNNSSQLVISKVKQGDAWILGVEVKDRMVL